MTDHRTMSTDAPCPACGFLPTKCLGELPPPHSVYPDWIDGEDTSRFYACPGCKLRFRSPVPPPEILRTRYENTAENPFWSCPYREVWSRVREMVERCPQRTILDVGCFRGDMLRWLGEKWQRFGIEPSVGAGQIASTAGIRIIGATIEDAAPLPSELGAIVLIDVLEHLSRPLEALKILARSLVPHGRIVIFTGDSEYWTWKLGGRHYWYSALPEHLTFFSRSWFHWAAPQLDCDVRQTVQMANRPASVRERLLEAGRCMIYLLYCRFRAATGVDNAVAIPRLRRIGGYSIAWWTTARDHILIELEKRHATGLVPKHEMMD